VDERQTIQRKHQEEHVPEQTFDDVFLSLTGFEEIAISERFGVSVGKLAEANETVFMRSLLFTDLVRSDLWTPDEARNTAMRMRLGEVQAWFATENADVLPDDPDSAVGKDGSQPATTPTTSPLSA
jgi:hypothetical protein